MSRGPRTKSVWFARRGRPWLWGVAFVLAMLGSEWARAGAWAVVGADVDADRLAASVRTAVALPGGTTMLHEATLIERLSPPRGPVVDLAAAHALLAAANASFQAVEHDRSISYLESLIVDLERDTTFSAEKLALLQTARLQAARQLLGLAGPSETGRAETPPGIRARAHLAAALRADPTLVLDPARTPPKLRALLSLATEDVKQQGYGSIAVQSTPPGATVLLEGRQLGLTPLVTAATIARGRYRLWVEKDGRASMQRIMVVGSEPVVAELHLVVEGALRPAGPGLRPPLIPFGPDDVARIAARLDVERLIVVGRERGDVWAVAVDRAGVVRATFRAPEASPTTTPQVIAAAVGAVAVAPPDPTALPSSYFVMTTPTAPAAVTDALVDDDGLSPLVVGAAIGGAVVVASGATAAALWLWSSEKTTVGVSVRRAP
jgi:hypothetical protein